MKIRDQWVQKLEWKQTDTTDRIALPLTQSAQLRSQQISYQVIMQWMAG